MHVYQVKKNYKNIDKYILRFEWVGTVRIFNFDIIVNILKELSGQGISSFISYNQY